MRVRTTITISVAYDVQSQGLESEAETLRRIENSFLEDLNAKVAHHVAMAKGPGGTITWDVRPSKDPA